MSVQGQTRSFRRRRLDVRFARKRTRLGDLWVRAGRPCRSRSPGSHLAGVGRRRSLARSVSINLKRGAGGRGRFVARPSRSRARCTSFVWICTRSSRRSPRKTTAR